MFKKLKMKIAAKRVEQKKRRRTNKTQTAKKSSFWPRVWNAICVPFRAIGRAAKRVWSWICGINLVGLANITLLCAIIVLFSILITNLTGYNKSDVVLVAQNEVSSITNTQVNISETNIQRIVRPRTVPSLPLQHDAKTRKLIDTPINVAHVRPDRVAKCQTARIGKTMYGDVIVDSRGAATMLHDGDTVHGNLYLQNMGKYTLPCNMQIDGNLFLRDVGMLQFCGDFTVRGNIYVSPRSSFGPIPRTARIGGQVIL